MKNQEIKYKREEQDEQRYERQRERWLEGLAENERQKDLPTTDERQPEDGQ
jgi:hypothetical protein